MNRIVTSIAVASLALLSTACLATPSPTPQPSIDPNAIWISANALKFDKTELAAPADEPFQIAFDNREGAPHNVSIYRDEAMSQKVFAEDPVAGPRLVAYDVPALPAGSYVFVCDVHRGMRGTLTAQKDR